MPREIERALARLAGRRRPGGRTALPPLEDSHAFRAVVEERFRQLERQLDEVKGRINGLFLLIAGAILSQIVLRLVEK